MLQKDVQSLQLLTDAVRSLKSIVDAPLPRTADQWADAHRILPQGVAEAGPWRSSRTPYMTEPVRAFKNPNYRRIVWVMGSQMGKTANQFNVIGHRLDDDPAPVLYLGPTQSNIRTMIEPKIMDMIHCTPSLERKYIKSKSTKTLKVINGIPFRMAWAGSAAELASDSAAIGIVDEVDRMASSVKGEGDPVELMEARTSTFPDGKVGVASTPTVGTVESIYDERSNLWRWNVSEVVESPIWRLWQEGTRHEWAWPCPHCEEYFIPRMDCLKWPEDSTPESAGRHAKMGCPHCNELIESKYKDRMNRYGVFVAPAQTSHGAHAIRRMTSNDVRMDMLLAIPGLGKELVGRVLKKCGSIEEMCFPEALKQVKGLGEVKRKRIVEVLTSEEPIQVERTVRRR